MPLALPWSRKTIQTLVPEPVSPTSPASFDHHFASVSEDMQIEDTEAPAKKRGRRRWLEVFHETNQTVLPAPKRMEVVVTKPPKTPASFDHHFGSVSEDMEIEDPEAPAKKRGIRRWLEGFAGKPSENRGKSDLAHQKIEEDHDAIFRQIFGPDTDVV